MTPARAAEILGENDGPGSHRFREFVLALQEIAYLEIPSEVERLEAALWAQRNPKAYLAEIRRRRARIFSHTPY